MSSQQSKDWIGEELQRAELGGEEVQPVEILPVAKDPDLDLSELNVLRAPRGLVVLSLKSVSYQLPG